MGRARFLAEQIGLTDDERHELAMMLPDRWRESEPLSWGKLTDSEVALLCSWLKGAVLVITLRDLRHK